VVTNAPNIGGTPKVQALGAAAVAAATQLSFGFNGALAPQLAGLKAGSPGLNIYSVDVGALTTQIVANPAQFGFSNVTTACFNTLVSPPTLCADPAPYAFWDPFHPTATAHALLAQRVLAAIGH
jgi:outer membrane lipase/esterase